MRHVIVLGSAAAVQAFRQRGGATSISPDQVHYVTDLRTADLLGAVLLRGGDVLLFLDNGAATEAVWAVRSRKVYDVGNPLEIYLQGDPLRRGGPIADDVLDRLEAAADMLEQAGAIVVRPLALRRRLRLRKLSERQQF